MYVRSTSEVTRLRASAGLVREIRGVKEITKSGELWLREEVGRERGFRRSKPGGWVFEVEANVEM